MTRARTAKPATSTPKIGETQPKGEPAEARRAEAEVTPAMLKAGMDVARDGCAGDDRYFLDHERLTAIYRAMEKAGR
jgi:hypothetical protein